MSATSSRRVRTGPARVVVIESEEHYFLCESTLELLGPETEPLFLLGRGLSPGNRATKDWRRMFRSRADGRDVIPARHRTIFLRAIVLTRHARTVYIQTGPDFGSLTKVLGFLLFCRLRGDRTIVSLHEVTAYLRSSRRLTDRIRSHALRYVRGVVFESDALREFFREDLGAARTPRLGVVRVRYAPSIDEREPIPERSSDPEGRLRVGLVGGVTRKRRDYAVLESALKMLDPEERSRIRLITLGNCTKQRCFDIMDPLAELVAVDLVNRHLSEQEFLDRGASCHILLAPLIADLAYGRRKGTGAFADATRLARRIIVPRDSDPLQEFAALTLPYDDAATLAAQLRRALGATPSIDPGELRTLEVPHVRERLREDLRLEEDFTFSP